MTCSNQKSISKIKGNTYSRSFIFKDKLGSPINLTGSVIKFSVKKNVSDTVHVLQENLSITDAVNGKASISVDLTMEENVYTYDFQWIKSDGKKETFEIGKLTITNGAA